MLTEKANLRSGYTTGACAAAAAKGSAFMIFSGRKINEIEITLPAKEKAVFKLHGQKIDKNSASCFVVKDAGDDPDVTNGIKIFAKAKQVKNYREKIRIKAGEGIGTVTKPGLGIKIGEPAINLVPRKMIAEEVKKALPQNKGVEITIFCPEGKKIAKKTMNEKLGIVNGISILGTTGIVEPMSIEAFKRSLVSQIDIAVARNFKEVVLTPGRKGEVFAISKGIDRDAVIITSNFIGYLLDRCAEKGIKKVLILGSPGKIVKLAGGIFYTHSKASDAKLEIIAAYTASLANDKKLINLLLSASSAQEAFEILNSKKLTKVFDVIAEKARERCEERVERKLKIGIIMLSVSNEIIAKSKNTEDFRWAKYLS